MWQKDAKMDESTRTPIASGNSDIDSTGTVWPHNLQIFTAHVPHLEKVFSTVRQRYRVRSDNSGFQCAEILGNFIKYSIVVSFEGCSEQGIAVLSDTIQRNRPLQHFTCDTSRQWFSRSREKNTQ